MTMPTPVFVRSPPPGPGPAFRSYNRQLWKLEVKTSLDERVEFSLGETEVVAARDSAIKREVEYRIVCVSYAGDPENLSIDMLPNPLSEEGRGFYTKEGEGLRYSFRRSGG